MIRGTIWGLLLTVAAWAQNAPLALSTPNVPDGQVGVPYAAVTWTASNGHLPYFWDYSGQLPPGLTFQTVPPAAGASGAMGRISGTPTQAGTFTFVIVVSDAREAFARRSYTVTVSSAGPLTLTTPEVPNAPAGVPYPTVTWRASGGSPPYTWSTSGSVPQGLSLQPTGSTPFEPGGTSATLSGVPVQAGEYQFAVVVTDSLRNSVTRPYSIRIAPAAPPLTLSPSLPTLAAAQVTAAYEAKFTAAGGQPPYRWSASTPLPAGLSFRTIDATTAALAGTPTEAGSFSITVTLIDALGAELRRSYAITVAAAPPPANVQLSRTRVDFGDVPLGGNPPDPQWVNVTAAAAAVRFTTDPDPVSWLTATPARATAPARITLRVDQATLGLGRQTARVRVSGSSEPIEVTVNVVQVPARLEVSPTYLQAQGRVGVRDTVARTLNIRNAGGGGSQAYQIQVVNRSPWIRLLNASGAPITGGQAPVRLADSVSVALDVPSLQRGVYRDVIRVTSAAGNQDVPVTLLVSADSPILGVNPDGVQFESRQGSGTAVTRNVQIQNRGAGAFAWSAEVVRGGEWLALGSSQGTASADSPGSLPLSVNSAALASKPYYGLVRVNAPGALNSPQLFTVTLNVTPPGSPAQAAPSPSGLFFSAPSGSQPPAAQVVRVFTSTDQPLTFVAGTATEDSSGWLSVANNTGNTGTASPGEVPVIVNPTNLEPGIYKGEVGVTLPDNTVRTVNITFVVTPRVSTAAARAAKPGEPRHLAGCTPEETVATHTGLISNFSTAVGWPTPLTVRVADDCAEPVLGASVVASFSNGDPPIPLTLSNSQQGLYSGTWTPRRSTDQVSITARVTAPGLAPSTASINGASRDSQAPVIAVNGLVNNLYPQIGGAMAPGTVAALFGSSLAPNTQSPTTVPLPTNFLDTIVLVGGREAPLFYVSPTQVNVQIPTELAAENSYQVISSVQGAISVPERIVLAPVAPGLLGVEGRVIAQHLDFSLVDSAKPAAPNEIIVLYLVGMGATEPAVATGQLSPLAPVTAPATVTIDGRPATVHYAGLTPGGIGLYQINVQLPADVPDGDLRLLVTQAGIEANAVTIPVRRQ